jgi:hypothetical protein
MPLVFLLAATVAAGGQGAEGTAEKDFRLSFRDPINGSCVGPDVPMQCEVSDGREKAVHAVGQPRASTILLLADRARQSQRGGLPGGARAQEAVLPCG